MLKPQVFGRYLLLDKVASGGMAEVWRAKLTGEAGFQRIVAIKKILPHVAEDSEFIAMFTDEANITSRLQHANIGQVYEFSRLGDTYFIGMEYISGKDLKTVWSYNRSRKSTIPIDLAAFIVARMADGLDYAHRLTDNYGNQAGIVHRDVSPQNVLLSWDGEVKVIDFGIAKAQEKSGRTKPGTLKGKFAYMSPEQIRGLGLDGRADVFALGVVLYELCTGERGFTADSEFSLLEMVRNVDIRPPTIVNREIPAELERIIYKALAKDREHRYQTAAELSEDLQRFLIMKGKPPSRQDLASYLRTNFTVDWEKERARLESYREIAVDDLTADEAPAPAPRKPKGPTRIVDDDDVGHDETAEFRPPDDDDGGADDDGTFASSAPTATSNPRGAIRPAARTTPVAVSVEPPPPPRVQQPAPVAAPPPSGLKLFAIAAGLTLAIAGGALAVWKLVLVGKGTVVVTVQGANGAMVRFDDRAPSRAEPSITIDKVGAGVHTIIVEEAGFLAFSTTVVTSADTPLLQVKALLKRVAGKLVVTSEPPGAAIILDGKPTGQSTPATFEVEGETLHELTLKRPGFKEARKTAIKAPAGGELPVVVPLIPEKILIRLTTVPEGATVTLSGAVLGTTPLEIERAPTDPYPQVEISMKRCEPKKTSIPFDPNGAPEQPYLINLKCK